MSGECEKAFESLYCGPEDLKPLSKSRYQLGWIGAAVFLQKKARSIRTSNSSPESMRRVALINECVKMLVDEVEV